MLLFPAKKVVSDFGTHKAHQFYNFIELLNSNAEDESMNAGQGLSSKYKPELILL